MTQVHLSSAAAARVAAIAAKQGRPGLKLRLAVDGGGCAGFQYKFGLESAAAADDLVVETDGVAMLVDPVSLPFLDGARSRLRGDDGRGRVQGQQPQRRERLRLRLVVFGLRASVPSRSPARPPVE